MEKPKIGYLALSKASWMTPKINGIVEATLKSLKSLPADILGEGVVTTEEEARRRAVEFTRAGVDAVVMHFATFPLGAAIPAAAQELQVPVILLANPEEAGPGGMWEQNSFCGANMAAHGLNRLRKRYGYVMAAPKETAAALRVPLAAVRALRGLKTLRVGLVGGRVPGFYTSNFDEMQLRRELGVTVEVLDLLELVKMAERLESGEVEAAAKVVKAGSSKVNAVPAKEMALAAQLYGAFRSIAKKYDLNTFAARCWPEFSDLFGIAPCAVLGMLSDAGLPVSCEGDVTGVVTMKLLQLLAGGGVPFFVDLIRCDAADNTGVVWHCGAAPASLCRAFSDTQYRLHMRVDGGDKKGLTNDFALKPGRVTVAKLDTDVDGTMRMLVATGTALDTEPFIRGNPLRIKFDDPVPSLVDLIMQKGFEHHYAVIHADVKAELLQFCEWTKIEPVMAGK